MVANDLIGPAVVAAVVSGIVSIVSGFLSNRTARGLHSEKLKFDEALAEKRYGFEVDLAERKFRFDRELPEHKRRIEFAEQLLADFYRLADIIKAVRSPAAYGSEGATRQGQENESEDVARARNTYYVPLERLRHHREFLSSFFSRRYQARAIFTGQIDEAFQAANEAVGAIEVAAGMLIQYAGNQDHNPTLFQRLELDIWDGFGDESDVISAKVKNLVSAAETVLGSILINSETSLAAQCNA